MRKSSPACPKSIHSASVSQKHTEAAFDLFHCAAVIPRSYYPKFAKDALAWHCKNTGDPIMCHGGKPFPAWIRGLIAFEMARPAASSVSSCDLHASLSLSWSCEDARWEAGASEVFCPVQR